MKKLYTLALGALLAGTATASELSLTAPRTRSIDFKDISTELRTVKAGVETFSTPGARMAAQQAPTRAAESDIADKEYLLQGYGVLFNEQTNDLETLGVSEITKDNDKLKYGPFLFDGLYFDAKYDPATMTLTIPAGQSVTLTEDDFSIDLTLYSYNFDDEQAHDIVFSYYPEERVFYYESNVDDQQYYTDCIVLGKAGATPGTTLYAYLFIAYNYMVNSVMAEVDIDDSGNIGDPTYYSIYVEQNGNKIVIDNMFDTGFSAHPEFTLDVDAKTLSATRPILYQSQSGSISLLGVDETGYTTDNVVFSQLTDAEEFIFQAAAVALTDGTQIVPCYVPQILIPFDPYAGAGVKGVEISTDANAPVEYFNLQGVRVANPENGLYIRRQGNKVEKVIIR